MYGALFNASYVPNPLEATYLANPPKFLAPYMFGGLVSHFFFGIFTCQVVSYFSAFGQTDPWLQRSHVALVVLLTWFKIVQIILALWKREANDWGNFFELTQIEPATRITGLSSACVTVAVQIYFINRCFRLSRRNYFFLIPTSLVCALSFGASVWTTISMPDNFSTKDVSFIEASRVLPAASVATDTLITLFSLYYLVRARRDALSKTTDNVIMRLLKITVQSALPPLLTTAAGAAFTGQEFGPYVFMFLSISPLLQAFSMMYTLNCRFQLRQASTGNNISDEHTTIRWGNPTSHAHSTVDHIRLQNVSVNVSRTVETHHELSDTERAVPSSEWYPEDTKQQQLDNDSGSFEEDNKGRPPIRR